MIILKLLLIGKVVLSASRFNAVWRFAGLAFISSNIKRSKGVGVRVATKRRWLTYPIIVLATAITADAQTTTTYTYDALGRLQGSSRSDGLSTAIALDAAGNRTNVTTSGVAGAVTVNDFSFEDPDVGTSYAYNQGGASTSFQGNSGVAANGSAWGFAASPNGKQVGFLQDGNGSRIILSFNGTVPGHRYQLQFKAQSRPSYPAHSFTVQVNGQQVGAVQSGPSFQQYNTIPFTATQTIGAVEFDTTDVGYDCSSGIDDVRIVPV